MFRERRSIATTLPCVVCWWGGTRPWIPRSSGPFHSSAMHAGAAFLVDLLSWARPPSGALEFINDETNMVASSATFSAYLRSWIKRRDYLGEEEEEVCVVQELKQQAEGGWAKHSSCWPKLPRPINRASFGEFHVSEEDLASHRSATRWKIAVDLNYGHLVRQSTVNCIYGDAPLADYGSPSNHTQ